MEIIAVNHGDTTLGYIQCNTDYYTLQLIIDELDTSHYNYDVNNLISDLEAQGISAEMCYPGEVEI